MKEVTKETYIAWYEDMLFWRKFEDKLAAVYIPAGIILETPFTSMIDAAKTFYPYIPVNLLLKDKFENYKKVKNINSPILVMHGEVDQIVPFSMGKQIYEIANEPKYSYFTKYDNHMMEFDERLVFAIQSFIESLN